ncbi:MAG: DUF2934 domain-containing protein [Alphaproteobacteria bacterium]|nr:DUF2934 domain-containing protein [Alphaproteobacteria bacterium]MBR3661718.1 DUF2934 domain-containing protein [Alphaproteobacteria bacterium]
MSKTYNENYIKEAAYYNWQNAGCPSGKDEYFWNMAISQLYGSSCSCSSTSKSCSSKSSSAKSKTTSTSTSKKK